MVAPTSSGTEPKQSVADKEVMRLADAARCEVYVCLERPLGAHLKPEVREKLWKGEYLEIFSLLPLEKINLDRVKLDGSKKEEEEKRRYWLSLVRLPTGCKLSAFWLV